MIFSHQDYQSRFPFPSPGDLPDQGIELKSPVSPVLQMNSLLLSHLQFSLVQSCPTICNPMNRSTPGLPVHHQLPELTQTHVHRVGNAIQPSHPVHPLLLPPSIFPSIRVFSNESALHIRWPKYWSFSFNITPSNEHP